MMKRLVALFSVLSMISVAMLTGCGSSSADPAPATDGDTSSDGETYTMRIAHVVAETHPSHVTLMEFEKTVEAGTNGAVQVELVPNGSLGGEAQMAEMIGLDSIQGTVIGADAASGIIPELALIGAPYLFDSRESAYAALDGEFGAELAALAESHNMYTAGWGDAGFRNVTNSRHEIVTPADLQGIKIRVMENELHMKLFQEFGANPSPLAFNELFTALQQGTIDACENATANCLNSGYYEVTKNVTFTQHAFVYIVLCMSDDAWNKIPEDLREPFLAAVQEGVEYERNLLNEANDDAIAKLKDLGVNFYDIDVAELQAAYQAKAEEKGFTFDPEWQAAVDEAIASVAN